MAIDWRRLPHLPRENDERTAIGEYRRDLNRVLAEKFRDDAQQFDALGKAAGALITLAADTQSITANVATTVAFDTAALDTLTGWDAAAFTYTPARPGYYRCAWSVRLGDSGAIATSTAGLSYLMVDGVAYADARGDGNGAATRIATAGSTIVHCTGQTAISVQALLTAGSAPIVVGATGTSSPTWLAIDFIGT